MIRRNTLFFIMALALTLVFFRGMSGNEFFFLHDEFLVLGEDELIRSSFTHDSNNFGASNTTSLFVNFFDRLYYASLYHFDISPRIAQECLFLLKLYLVLAVPYVGFRNLAKLFLSYNKESTWILLISLWYTFNTYTLIFWNGNGFSLTLIICYALAPLTLFYIHRSLFDVDQLLADKLKAAILVYCMSFALPLFLAFVLLVIVYFTIYALLTYARFYRVKYPHERHVQEEQMGATVASVEKVSSTLSSPASLFKNALFLFILYVPFSYAYLLIAYGMFSDSGATMHLTGGETYGGLQGGILYQLLMWYSWGIYTYWEPRSIFTFYEYFRSPFSLIAPFFLYFIIAYGIYKKNLKNIHFLSLFTALLIFLVLVKGAQDPFGAVYLYLLDHISIFRAFRSPDSKFGFVIVLTLAMLLLFALKYYRKKIFTPLLIAVILIQGYPLFTGVAIKGENTDHSYDRIIHVSNEYLELASFLNTRSDSYGYVMTLPSVEFGLFQLGEGEQFIGQDLLPKLIRLPFVFISENGSLPVSVYRDLSTGVFTSLVKYPIRYYIFRNDIKSDEYDIMVPPQNLELIFQNNLFRLYENHNTILLLQAQGDVPVAFEKVSPVEYRINLKGLRAEEMLNFSENYSEDWKLFPDRGERYAVSYLWITEVAANTHVIGENFSNSWTLDPTSLRKFLPKDAYKENPDGSMDIELTLYFYPQSFLLLGFIVSTVTLLGYLMYLLYVGKKRVREV